MSCSAPLRSYLPLRDSRNTGITLLELLEVGSLLLLAGGVKVLDKLRNALIVDLALFLLGTTRSGSSSSLAGSQGLVRLSQPAEVGERVGAELVEDTWDKLSQLLGLTATGNSEGVGGKGRLDCRLVHEQR